MRGFVGQATCFTLTLCNDIFISGRNYLRLGTRTVGVLDAKHRVFLEFTLTGLCAIIVCDFYIKQEWNTHFLVMNES